MSRTSLVWRRCVPCLRVSRFCDVYAAVWRQRLPRYTKGESVGDNRELVNLTKLMQRSVPIIESAQLMASNERKAAVSACVIRIDVQESSDVATILQRAATTHDALPTTVTVVGIVGTLVYGSLVGITLDTTIDEQILTWCLLLLVPQQADLVQDMIRAPRIMVTTHPLATIDPYGAGTMAFTLPAGSYDTLTRFLHMARVAENMRKIYRQRTAAPQN